MLPFFKQKKHKEKTNEPIVPAPMNIHKKSEQFTIFLILAMLIKQNKFNIVHDEYEYCPYYPIIDAQEYYRVNFPNGDTFYEISREMLDRTRYRLTINTPTQRITYSPSNQFMYAEPLFELTATGKLSPEFQQELTKWSKDGQPLHYLASLLTQSK